MILDHDGDETTAKGSGKTPYVLRNIGGVIDCSCPAWKNQSREIDVRTCKHICKVRGNAIECARVGYDGLPTAVKKKFADPLGATQTAAAAGVAGVPLIKVALAAKKAAGPVKKAPPLLLAHTWDGEQDPTGKWLSEKLDGVRAKWTGSVFLSRLGNVFHAPEYFTQGFPNTPLDGELFLARGEFQKTVSIVRRKNGGDLWKQLRYLVFDVPEHGGVFEDRDAAIPDLIDIAPYAEAVFQRRCAGAADVKRQLAAMEAVGGEGLMLREAGSLYVDGRSHTLLKVVSFKSDEATVYGYTKGKGRHLGVVGALKVRRADGAEFKVGTGLSDAQRKAPPSVGAVITFNYRELTKAGIPRFPSFVGERIDAVA